MSDKIYCLDAGVFINPWNYYYTQQICPSFWELLLQLASEGCLISPHEIYQEIQKQDDGLSKWLKSNKFPFEAIDENIQDNMHLVMEKFPLLIDSKSFRSMGDPWVIATAMSREATVVTTERSAPKKIKIPDACHGLGIPCITEFQFVHEIGIRFEAVLSKGRDQDFLF